MGEENILGPKIAVDESYPAVLVKISKSPGRTNSDPESRRPLHRLHAPS